MKPSLTMIALAFALAAGLASIASAALRGHGGPVRALAISADGSVAVTGSFDSAAIIWSLQSDTARQVLRFHGSAVNAVAQLPDGRLLTAGEDAKIALWREGQTNPERIFSGHTAPIAGLAVHADGRRFATASWDRTIRIWDMDKPEIQSLEGHTDNVNAVAFLRDGTLVSGGYDATLRFWPLASGAPKIIQTPSPINALAVGSDGAIVTAHADGHVRFFAADGAMTRQLEIAPAPLISLAVSPDGHIVATAGLRGAVMLIDRRDPLARRMLVGPALPVWALAFTQDGKTILAAGSDRLVRRWDAATGQARDGTILSQTDDILKKYADDPGARVFRACVACHTLSADDDNRAGPTLHKIFGRKIGSAPGYHYSDALKGMDIVWTPETVAKLFEVGPMVYTPGTKMPEQTLSSAEDRAALIAFLQKAAH